MTARFSHRISPRTARVILPVEFDVPLHGPFGQSPHHRPGLGVEVLPDVDGLGPLERDIEHVRDRPELLVPGDDTCAEADLTETIGGRLDLEARAPPSLLLPLEEVEAVRVHQDSLAVPFDDARDELLL